MGFQVTSNSTINSLQSTMNNPKAIELRKRIKNIDSMLSPKDIRDRYSKSGQNALVRMRSTAVELLKEMGETE